MPRFLRLSPLAPLLLLCLAGEASAFCRARTCKPADSNCEFEGICNVSGLELFRKSSCASYAVEQSGSTRHDISAAKLDDLVQKAFDRWLGADCGGGKHPSIAIESLGSVECDEVRYNELAGNASIVVFRDDDWPHPSTDAYALTTVSYEVTTGEIYDADIEINGLVREYVTSAPEDGTDLQSILTHEVGHFLGLAHSDDPMSVMRERYTPVQENLRVLSADDIEGICTIYPPDRKAKTDSCAPRHGFASECISAPLVDGGCSVASRAGRGASVFAAVAVALSWFGRRRLRRRLVAAL